MAKTPVLDLDTLVERPTVKFGGGEYEMLNPGELGIIPLLQFARLSQDVAAFQAVAGSGADADEAARKAAAALEQMVEMILEAPAEVRARLTDRQKSQVIGAFNELTLKQQPAAAVSAPAAGEATESHSTGAS